MSDTSSTLESYFETVKKAHIPKGSTLPHPPGWKGDHGKNGKRKALTQKQMAVAKFMAEGHTIRQARIKAGYSEKGMVRMPLEPSVRKYFESMKDKLVDKGMDEEFIVNKFWEWLNARRTIVTKNGVFDDPDYRVQMDAYDRFKEIFNPKENKGKKKELVLTEWITEDQEQQQS